MRGVYTRREKLEKTRDLPLGHYDRTNAEVEYKRSVNAEYAKCRALEEQWRKKIPTRYLRMTPTIALPLIHTLCDALGTKQMSWIYFDSPEVDIYSAAHYNPKTKSVHFAPYMSPRATTVVHETAHHIAYTEKMGYGHQDGFLEVEELLFQITIPYLKALRDAEDNPAGD